MLHHPAVLKETRYCYIPDIVVKEGFRYIGFGQKLLDAVKSWAKAKGIGRIELKIVPGNRSAYSFYEKNGFKAYTHDLYIDL